jgi:glycosyltransferase involved in cell wall biosynthesis
LQAGNDFEYLTTYIPYIQMPGPFVPSFTKKNNFDNTLYKNIINDFKPDIIHSNLFRSELYTTTHVVKNVAYVVHGHDNMKEFKSFKLTTLTNKALLTNFLEKCILILRKYIKNKKTYFIANSQDTLKYYQKSVPIFLKKNVKLIEYGFDLDRFYNTKRNTLVSNQKIKLINVGRFAIYKNQKLLIEVAKKLKNKGISFELNLLGVGEQFENIRKLIHDYDLNNEVFLRGNVNDVENWLNQSTIYLHSAYYEPFGLVLLEAMASGLPCVILNGKGNADIIKNNFNGYIFDKEDPNLFVQKIIELSSKDDLYHFISVNARQYASQFAIGPKTDELINFYKTIIR